MNVFKLDVNQLEMLQTEDDFHKFLMQALITMSNSIQSKNTRFDNLERVIKKLIEREDKKSNLNKK